MPQLLFLCTGNYYRSRFAEAWFNHHAAAQNLDWRACSRGLAIERGVHNVGPISPYARQHLAQRGIALREPLPLPQGVTETDFATADRVIAIDESEHRPLMTERWPHWAETIDYWLIHDIDRTDSAIALAQLAQHIEQLLTELKTA
jgi:protein-tyrosine phosphatase